jgi:hypothetical protein
MQHGAMGTLMFFSVAKLFHLTTVGHVHLIIQCSSIFIHFLWGSFGFHRLTENLYPSPRHCPHSGQRCTWTMRPKWEIPKSPLDDLGYPGYLLQRIMRISMHWVIFHTQETHQPTVLNIAHLLVHPRNRVCGLVHPNNNRTTLPTSWCPEII